MRHTQVQRFLGNLADVWDELTHAEKESVLEFLDYFLVAGDGSQDEREFKTSLSWRRYGVVVGIRVQAARHGPVKKIAARMMEWMVEHMPEE